MILTALSDYYDRLSKDPDSGVAAPGLEKKAIDFIVVLNQDGSFRQILDNRTGEGKKKQGRPHLVPQAIKRTVGIAANLLWDNIVYALGVDAKGKPKRTALSHEAFINRIEEAVRQTGDEGAQMVLSFLRSDRNGLESDAHWEELTESTGNVTFSLTGEEMELVCQRPAIVDWSARAVMAGEGEKGLCLVTGKIGPLVRLHAPIKNVWGAQSSGANIVSTNLAAFKSQGESQSNNAPVSTKAAFAYTTALNYLLAKGSAQRIQVGDASTVFWAEQASPMEVVFKRAIESVESPQDWEEIKTLYRSPELGVAPIMRDETKFYVLGLAPNASRIAIRFWHNGTVGRVAQTMARHFADLKIIHGPKEPDHLPLFWLLKTTAALGKADNIPPNLGGDFMKAILDDRPYPRTLLSAAVRRARAEQSIPYVRAALIKACLVRQTRCFNRDQKEVDVSLDVTNNNIGYLLGRLFAVLERIQVRANPGINTTIRDRFYASASATPTVAFSHLLKLKNHHLSKMENKGEVVNLERLIGGIMDLFNEFPKNLSLDDQGRFNIGYYHQRQDFFRKKSTETEANTENE